MTQSRVPRSAIGAPSGPWPARRIAAAGAFVTPFAAILALVTIAVSVWLLVKGAPRRALLWWAIGLSVLSLVVLAVGGLAFALTVD